eukprot:91350-Ditylum_brightwellii.AAC.1
MSDDYGIVVVAKNTHYCVEGKQDNIHDAQIMLPVRLWEPRHLASKWGKDLVSSRMGVPVPALSCAQWCHIFLLQIEQLQHNMKDVDLDDIKGYSTEGIGYV